MDLQPFVDDVRDQLLAAADTGTADTRFAADRMTAVIESALRLALLEVVAAAAQEITLELAPGSVDVRLRGRDPEFEVMVPLDHPLPTAEIPAAAARDADESGAARITLRLSESLKQRAEDAAGSEGLSVNAWLVRVLTAATDLNRPQRAIPPTSGQAFTGWVR